MSLYTNQVSINSSNYFFLLANVSTLTAQNIVANSISTNTITGGSASISSMTTNNLSTFEVDAFTISTQNLEANFTLFSSMNCLDGNISSIVTNNIVLDGNFLDTGGAGAGATLLLNGFPIVTGAVSSFSTLSDWAYFPAASTVNFSANDITNVKNINSQNIFNALNIQTDTLSALTSVTAPTGTITALRATTISSVNANLSNVNVASNIVAGGSLTIPTVSTTNLRAQTVTASGVSSLTVSTGVLRAGGISSLNVSTGNINGQPFISGSNWSQYPATSAVNFNGQTLTNNTNQTFTIAPTSNLNITTSNGNLVANYPVNITAGDVNITANSGSDIGANATVNIVASNGNRGRINLIAQPGFGGVQGEIGLTANGGSIGGVGFGGLIELTANTPVGLSNLTSAIKFSAAGINSYAGAIPSIGSLAGYNFIYGNLGVNITAGLPPGALPNTAGTVYLYGTLGIEIPSDAYMKNIYPYWDGLTTPPDLFISGRYILPNLAQVCVRMSNVRQIYFQENVGTFMSNCDNIAMSSNGVITTSNFGATNGTIGTLSNTNLVGAGSGNISGYVNVGTNNLNTNFINSIPIANYLGGNLSTFTTASISSATISSINGLPINSLINPTVSTFQTASISSLNVSTLNSGIRVGQKSLVVTGDVAQLQCSNTAGQQGSLNLLMRQNYGEIQSFNSNFTLPLNLMFTADNFGFNVPPDQITGGYEVDISGSTQVRNGQLRVFDPPTGDESILTANTLQVSSITGLSFINNTRVQVFGEFLTTGSVPVAAANTPTVIPLDTNTVGNFVSLNAGGIRVAETGLYKLYLSLQLDKSGGGTDPCDFWVRVNGNDVANTASQVTLQGNTGEILGNVSLYLSLNANDTIEIVFASSDASMTATYFPAWVTPGDPYDRPAIPAVIANIQLLR